MHPNSSRPMSELLGVTEKDFELSEEAGKKKSSKQLSPLNKLDPKEDREVNTGSVDTGYKDFKGRPIKLSPQKP